MCGLLSLQMDLDSGAFWLNWAESNEFYAGDALELAAFNATLDQSSAFDTEQQQLGSSGRQQGAQPC